MNDAGDFSRFEISLRSDGYLLKGEHRKPPQPKALLVLVHGIPMSRPDPSDGGYPELCAKLNGRGIATVFLNLRGTGESEGNFSMASWYRDVLGLMDYVLKGMERKSESLFLAGFSAGAAIALRFASEQRDISGVISFACPARFTEIFGRDEVFAFIELAREIGIIKDIQFPPDPFAFFEELNGFNVEDYVSRITPVPLLIVHGANDELVPVDHARRIFHSAGEPRFLRIVEGGTHHLRRDPRSVEIIDEWIDDVISGRFR